MNSIAETIQWPARAGAPPPAGSEIHVWATTLSVPAETISEFATTLSSDEVARAGKFKFEKHRNRYIAGRGALRKILGQYLQTPSADLRFTQSTNGKPVLAEDFASAGIHFNLAHSDDLALVAVTRLGAVGVDVERIRPVKEMDHLVARFFSPSENEAFQKVSENEKPAAFFNLWTRKEALLKATGEGITRSLSLVEVSFLPDKPAQLLAISGNAIKAASWSLRELSPATGFTGAIAIEAPEVNVQCWKWIPESWQPT
ncbi:MAG TPA: 4'-phosphopantetheinyl transferase superfamily protein [Verrucomicrobiae bacterium]|nr:4'-phosphopantetheinyl transferase superfamily protein [Verrucomicrobiae bacterium]